MLKGSDIIGKPIFAYDTGQQIEKIEDLIFDHKSNHILGFLVAEKTWISSAKVIPLQDIHAIGPDAVIAKWKYAVVPARKLPDIKKILNRNKVLAGTKLMTTDGRNLGTMVDLYFDERTGKIEGYEVTGGIFADAVSGRAFVPAPKTLKVGVDVAFVPPEIADLMAEQFRSIKDQNQLSVASPNQAVSGSTPVFQEIEQGNMTAGGKVQQQLQLTQETWQWQQSSQISAQKQQEFTPTAESRLQEVKPRNPDALSNTIIDPVEQKAFVIDKTVDRTVITPEGTPLVLQGQLVTLSDVEAAMRWGILNQLYMATGGNVPAQSNSIQQQVGQTSGENLQEFTQTTSENLPNETVNDQVNDSKIEQTRGRRVQEAVRTESGLWIAALGQIVTDRVIERATTYHKEQELITAVGLINDEPTTANNNSQLTTPVSQQQTSASPNDKQVADGVVPAKKEAYDLWGRLRKTVSDMQVRSPQISEEQLIKAALGRPVNRVILDKEDIVILDVGELITNKAIEKAKQAEVLDILLDSVDARTAEISTANRRT